MKFKRLVRISKNRKQKKMLIASLTVVILVVAGVFLYSSFASFTTTKEFNVIQGKIPRTMKGNMVFAFLLDDEKTYNREFSAFSNLDNRIKKIIITNDEIDYSTSMVTHIKLKDFLLLESLNNI